MDKSMELYPEANPKGCVEVSVASTLIPWDRDDERAMYFGYRASGLSVRESLHMIERSKPWLSLQRQDSKFVELEGRIPEFRDTLAKEYLKLETYRNYRMVLEKDRRRIEKSLRHGDEGILTRNEQEYLIKLRTMYTPAQLQILEALVSGGKGGFDFANWIAQNPDIVQMSRTDTVTMAKRSNGQDS